MSVFNGLRGFVLRLGVLHSFRGEGSMVAFAVDLREFV